MRIIIFLSLLMGILSIAANPNWTISSPPKGDDLRDNYQYNHTLFSHFNQIETVTTNPNGNRQGPIGAMVMYQATGNVYKFEIQVNSPNGNLWQGINLGVI